VLVDPGSLDAVPLSAICSDCLRALALSDSKRFAA
jgi:hypothetical protein